MSGVWEIFTARGVQPLSFVDAFAVALNALRHDVVVSFIEGTRGAGESS